MAESQGRSRALEQFLAEPLSSFVCSECGVRGDEKPSSGWSPSRLPGRAYHNHLEDPNRPRGRALLRGEARFLQLQEESRRDPIWGHGEASVDQAWKAFPFPTWAAQIAAASVGFDHPTILELLDELHRLAGLPPRPPNPGNLADVPRTVGFFHRRGVRPRMPNHQIDEFNATYYELEEALRKEFMAEIHRRFPTYPPPPEGLL